MQWQSAEVIENKHWNESLCSLRVDVTLPEYEAGQFVSLALNDSNGKPLARPYSIVNEPGADYCEFYFNRVEGGPLSPQLHRLKAGDNILVAARAAGFLVLSQVLNAEQLWLLATGTGIGPFLSMLQTHEPWMRFDKVVLIHGIRDRSEEAYMNELEALALEHPKQFQFHHAISREKDYEVLPKRITEALADGSLEELCQLKIDAKHSQVMLCGNPMMITESILELEKKGLKKNLRKAPGQITSEAYK